MIAMLSLNTQKCWGAPALALITNRHSKGSEYSQFLGRVYTSGKSRLSRTFARIEKIRKFRFDQTRVVIRLNSNLWKYRLLVVLRHIVSMPSALLQRIWVLETWCSSCRGIWEVLDTPCSIGRKYREERIVSSNGLP